MTYAQIETEKGAVKVSSSVYSVLVRGVLTVAGLWSRLRAGQPVEWG